MNKIINLSNILKFDVSKCSYCNNCIKVCKTRALGFVDGELQFYKDNCIQCKKCIENCETHALYFNINEDNDSKGDVALVPFNANTTLIQHRYKKIQSLELGEKIKIIETAFEMEKITSKKINNIPTTFFIVSDYLNLYSVFKNKYPNLVEHISKIKDEFYLTSYVTRLKSRNNNLRISSYGMPFECKLTYENIRIIDDIYDIPYSSKFKYSPIDILNIYMTLCKLNCDIDLSNLKLSDKLELNLSNKYINVKVLLKKGLENLELINYKNYDFVFILKNNNYCINEDILNDDEINMLYKKLLKEPGKTEAFFRKG
jgi:ferredoxin